MNIKYDLKTVANQIAQTSGGLIRRMKKYEDSTEEYFISEVTEQMLLDLGFTYKG